MTSQQDNITALLQGMKSSVSAFEQTKDRALLQQIDSDFQRFAQLATLFLIAERDSYYGFFLMSMTFRTNYAVSSIAGIRLGEYPPVFETNPLILLKYSLKEILYIFCHEIDHVVFNHPRNGEIEPWRQPRTVRAVQLRRRRIGKRHAEQRDKTGKAIYAGP